MSAYGSYADQAAREALLRFGPQRSNLADLIREAQSTYGNRIHMAHTAALGTKAAVNHALPQIRQIFAGAEGASQGTAHLLGQALQGAPADSPYRQSQASESALALQQLVARKAEEEARLKAKSVSAVQGQQFAGVAAQNLLTHELRSLLQKRGNLSGEEGAFASTQADKAAREAAKEAAAERRATRSDETTRRGQDLTRKSAQEAHTDAANKAGRSNAKAASTVRSIESLARNLFHEGHSRTEIEDALSTTQPTRTIVVKLNPKTHEPELDKNGDPIQLGKGEETGGRSITTAGRKAYARDVLMAAALDSAIGYEDTPGYGGVSPSTLAQLRDSKYSLKSLSLKPPRPARRRGTTIATRG